MGWQLPGLMCLVGEATLVHVTDGQAATAMSWVGGVMDSSEPSSHQLDLLAYPHLWDVMEKKSRHFNRTHAYC